MRTATSNKTLYSSWLSQKRRHLYGCIILGLICLCVLSTCGKGHSSVSPIHYTITDLGTLPHDQESDARAINDQGEVIGASLGYDPRTHMETDHAFVYSHGKMENLGNVGGNITGASGINRLGQVVGGGNTEHNIQYALIFHQDHTRPAILELAKFNDIQLCAINDRGQIIGWFQPRWNVWHGFLFDAATGKGTDLGTLPGDNYCSGYAINDSGLIVGESQNQTNITSHAVLYSDGKLTSLGMLGSDTQSDARGINASGQIVGSSCGRESTLSGTHLTAHGHLVTGQRYVSQAVLFHLGSTTPTPLGILPGDTDSSAEAINDKGQIVGASMKEDKSTEPPIEHAALFHTGSTTPIDLETGLSPADHSIWKLQRATGINNSGQICGDGVIHGKTHAFLMTPITAP